MQCFTKKEHLIETVIQAVLLQSAMCIADRTQVNAEKKNPQWMKSELKLPLVAGIESRPFFCIKESELVHHLFCNNTIQTY